ncbi:unnamed protein product [Candidula unifasciata]|uniref:tRNA-splicing endonuclease subunit Sen15 domain-containing protein n=1 Tax=Candidula unifasciata TaxID=100452 RepID=A0A8S3ZZU0_9EUPU|nr:unnamed protein product [Candidula unifasciata]
MSTNSDCRPDKHPLLVDFLLQYPKCDEDVAERAFLVYLDLTEVKGWWSTEMTYSPQLDRPYILGQHKRFVQRQAVLPVGVEECVSSQQMRQFFSHVLVDEEPIKSITLAVSELDSTVVYYKLSSGLLPPESPDMVVTHQRDKDARILQKKQFIAECVKKAMQRHDSN